MIRFLRSLRRPSKKSNLRLLQKRGEEIGLFHIREAMPSDIPALAALHVKTWNATYPGVKNKPTHQIREYQWNKAFEMKDDHWCCFLMEDKNGRLIGFAQGNAYTGELKEYKGQLNKIYLLPEYQRLGFGKKLICHVVKRFCEQGINSMLLFSEPQNPSVKFYEISGGKKILAANGEFHGGYGWKDLRELDC